MFNFLKKSFYKILKVFYWRKGKCLQCGQCCRTITLRFPVKLLTRESEFEYLKEKIPRFQHFYITGRADNGVLLFTCKYLTDDNRCSVYWMRSWFCRVYPHFDTKFIKMGGKPLKGCGYYYEPIESFDEVMNKAKKDD